MEKKELIIDTSNIRQSYELTNPDEVKKMSIVLKDYIVKNRLFVEISGRAYVFVEGWQFAGLLLGIVPIIEEVTDFSKDGEFKWFAKAKVVDGNGVTKSTGFALCSNKENKKKTFDEYAVLSMAQTRAIGKAYRNIIGWVMKLAGYEPLPYEETNENIGKKGKKIVDIINDIKKADSKEKLDNIKSEFEAQNPTTPQKRIIDDRLKERLNEITKKQ